MGQLQNVIVATDFAVVNGGQTAVAVDSAVALDQAKYNVTYFAAVGPVDKRLRQSNVNVVCLDQKDILSDPDRLRAIRHGLWNTSASKQLRDLCARFDPRSTVLHCHGYAKALSPAVGPLLTDGSVPNIFTMHEFFLACPNGGFYDYKAQEICKRQALGFDCLTTNCDVRSFTHKGWRIARQLITKYRADLPSGLRDVIYISELQRKLMEPYLNDRTRLHYVPNPVALDGPAKPVDAKSNTAFVFIGRLNPEKGGLLFAKAAKEAGVQAVFVGDGPERDAILEANPNAQITGWLDRNEVDNWLGRARCLVFPSVWYETFGLVAFEALNRRVPVVCGVWTAAAEGVQDGITGVHVLTPTVSSFSAALSDLGRHDNAIFDRILEAKLQINSPKDHLQRLVEVYEGVLSRAA